MSPHFLKCQLTFFTQIPDVYIGAFLCSHVSQNGSLPDFDFRWKHSSFNLVVILKDRKVAFIGRKTMSFDRVSDEWQAESLINRPREPSLVTL